LAAELRALHPSAELQMHPSSGGVFEVALDGTLLYSKKATGRHPQPGEIKRLIQEAIDHS
jgi:selenoprotein W-related protein